MDGGQHTVNAHGSKHGRAQLGSLLARAVTQIQDTDTTYKGKEVGKVIPPKVGTGEDPGNNPEDHREDGQADEDGVERDEAAIAGGRDPTHE